MISELLWTGVRVPPGDVRNPADAPLRVAGRADRGPRRLMVRRMPEKRLALICMWKKKQPPMAHWDNKTTEKEEEEDDAGREKSAASLIISEKRQKREKVCL